jgi:hypothetical protein
MMFCMFCISVLNIHKKSSSYDMDLTVWSLWIYIWTLNSLNIFDLLGHNWGSSHDPDTDECSPSSVSGGQYLMYSKALKGVASNNLVSQDWGISWSTRHASNNCSILHHMYYTQSEEIWISVQYPSLWYLKIFSYLVHEMHQLMHR